jgi:hypothetical protein
MRSASSTSDTRRSSFAVRSWLSAESASRLQAIPIATHARALGRVGEQRLPRSLR